VHVPIVTQLLYISPPPYPCVLPSTICDAKSATGSCSLIHTHAHHTVSNEFRALGYMSSTDEQYSVIIWLFLSVLLWGGKDRNRWRASSEWIMRLVYGPAMRRRSSMTRKLTADLPPAICFVGAFLNSICYSGLERTVQY
jgi:hypothetical protein